MNCKSFTLILTLLFLVSSCDEAGNLMGGIVVKVNDNQKPSIASVKVQNHQLIVTGKNLDAVTLAKIEGSTNHQFQIESKTSDKLVLNAKSALNFLVGGALNLVVSNATAAATFPVSFELQNGQVTASKLHHMGASTGDFLQFNGSNWVPASISSSQVYVGTYDANTDTPDIVAAGGTSGTYYIVTVAGDQNLGSGLTHFDVGDWIIYNGSSWSKVSVGMNTVSNFNGRTGAVVPLADDYSWSMLTKAAGKLTGSKLQEIADVDVAGIQDGDILQWNVGTSKWEVTAVPAPAIAAGSITNTQIASGAIDSTKIVDGSIVNADIAAGAAIDQAKINGLTAALSSKEATINTGSASQFWNGNKTWQDLNPAVIGSALTGFSSTTGAITATDSILSAIGKLSGNLGVTAASQANYVLKAGDTMSGPLAMGNNKITGLATPTNPTDAATMAYVDAKAGTASQWTTTGSVVSYSAGKVGIGTTAPNGALGISTDTHDLLSFDSYSSVLANDSADFVLRRGRGTAAAPQAVQTGDRLAFIGAYGYTSDAGFPLGGTAAIGFYASENYTNATKGSYINFGTTPTGTGSRKERMRITPEGNLGLGLTDPQGSIHVFSNNAPAPLSIGSESSLILESNPTTAGFQGAVGSIWFGSREISNTEGTSKAAGIVGYMPEDVTATSAASELLFLTTPSGSLTAAERLRISPLGNVGINNALPTEKLDVVGNIALTGGLRVKSGTGNYVDLRAPAGLGSNLALNLPNSNGTSGQALITDGAGNLSWSTVSSGAIADGSITYAKLNLADGDIPLAKLSGASDATKYLKGDKTWGTFITDVLASTFTTVTPANTVIANGDSLQTVVNKTQGQINQLKTDTSSYLVKNGTDSITGAVSVTGAGSLKIPTTPSGADLTDVANVQYVQNFVNTFGQWNKNGSLLYTNNYVGFGHNNPLSFLHAVGTGGTDDDIVVDSINDISESSIMLRRARGTAAAPTPPLTNDRLGFLGFRALTAAPSTYVEMARIQGAAETDIATTQSGYLQFYTRNSGTYLEKMRLNAAGRLGIGITTPEAKLHVAGSDWAGSSIYASRFENSQTGAAHWAIKSRGAAVGVYAPVLANDIMASFGGSGYFSTTATDVATAGYLAIKAESDWSAGSTPGLAQIMLNKGNDSYAVPLTATSTGRVGISTNNPYGPLEVAKDVTSPASMRDSAAIYFGGSPTTAGKVFGWLGVDQAGSGTAMLGVRKSGASYGNLSLVPDGGNVGIGTTSPTSTLEVASDASASIRGVTITHTSASNTPSLLIMRKSRGTITSPTATLLNDHLGYLAMTGHDGTNYVLAANPTGILASATENWSATGNGGLLRFYTTANGAVNGTERMRISEDGNVGIGTTSNPTAKLQVQGTLNGDVNSYLLNTDDAGTTARALLMVGTAASGTRYGYVSHQGAGYTANGALKPRTTVLTGTDTGGLNLLSNTQIGFWVGASEIMRVHSTGDVGIGTAAPSYKLHVNGSVAGVGAYNALSDRRYKKDFQKIPDALERVVKMNGFYYHWKQQENPEMQFEKGRDMGVIAQEVEKVFPEAVSTAKTSGIKSVAYSKLIAPMIEAIKELHQMVVKLFDNSEKHSREIASIKEENKQLKAKSVQLEQENAAFKAYLCQKDPKAAFCK